MQFCEIRNICLFLCKPSLLLDSSHFLQLCKYYSSVGSTSWAPIGQPSYPRHKLFPVLLCFTKIQLWNTGLKYNFPYARWQNHPGETDHWEHSAGHAAWNLPYNNFVAGLSYEAEFLQGCPTVIKILNKFAWTLSLMFKLKPSTLEPFHLLGTNRHNWWMVNIG